MLRFTTLITILLLLGCGTPTLVQHVPTSEEPHQVPTVKELPVEITTTLPETHHEGTVVLDNTEPRTQTWDWDDATTTITATPTVTEYGLSGTKLDVRTTVKPRTITLRDTITVSDTLELLVVRYPGVDSVFKVDLLNKTFLYTVTNDIEPCAGTDVPPLPPPGSDWWQYLLWAAGLVALLIGVGKRRNPKSAIRNPQSA